MAGFNPNTWPTFQQSMPMAQGAMTGEALQRAYLQNQRQKQQNKIQPGMDEANLQKILQYNQAQPDLDSARLAQMQSSTQGQDISNEQAPEALGLKEYMAKIAAQNAAHGMQNIDLQYAKLPGYLGNAFTRLSNTPSGETLLSRDPATQRRALEGISNFTQDFSQSAGGQGAPYQQGGFPPQKPQQYQPIPMPNFPALQKYMQGVQGTQGVTQDQQQPTSPSQQYIQGSQQAQPQPLPQPAQQQDVQPPQQGQSNNNISDDLVSQAQDATASRMQKQNISAQTANQRRYAVSLNKFGNTIEEKLPLVSRYFGIAGKANLLEDKALAQSGKQPKEYDIYQELVKTNFPDYANEFGRSMGIGATDKQKEAMKNVVNPDWMMSNPDLAYNVFKTLRKDESDIDKQLAMSPAQIQKYLESGGDKPKKSSPVSTPTSSNSAPAGTVNMVNPKDGQVYHVKEDQAEDAIASAGWRRA
jgi:hypothetical protein